PFQMVQDKKQESTMIIVDTDKQCDDSQFFLYDDRREIAQFLLFGDDCENKSFIEETKPNPVWEILDRDVVINNYNTVKAKAFINDRLWTIYYDSRMPVKANPWRFLGVNGLIIKAEDENKEYTFVLSKFPKHISKNSFNKELPFKKSSFLDYKKNAIESYRKDMIKELKKMTSNTEEEIIEILQPYETLEFIEKK
ncbi:MAG: GLPGLI family protein, partial [Cruoricaptor ignavus]|nr:GLPGLI family protein [Cruoricaptor ignavus]